MKKSLTLALPSAIAAALLSSAPASADGYLTPQEEHFGDAVAESVCGYIDNVGVNATSMAEAIKIIYTNTPANMDMTDAVDIINYSVYTYCPGHWDELVAFGEGARSQ